MKSGQAHPVVWILAGAVAVFSGQWLSGLWYKRDVPAQLRKLGTAIERVETAVEADKTLPVGIAAGVEALKATMVGMAIVAEDHSAVTDELKDKIRAAKAAIDAANERLGITPEKLEEERRAFEDFRKKVQEGKHSDVSGAT